MGFHEIYSAGMLTIRQRLDVAETEQTPVGSHQR